MDTGRDELSEKYSERVCGILHEATEVAERAKERTERRLRFLSMLTFLEYCDRFLSMLTFLEYYDTTKPDAFKRMRLVKSKFEWPYKSLPMPIGRWKKKEEETL